MIILGIDPGATGAFAWVDSAGGGALIAVMDMPMMEVRGKKRASISGVCSLMAMRPVDLVIIEAVHSMPGQGVASSFAFGYGAGALEGSATALGLSVELVRPVTWKKAAGAPADKGACRQMCQRYWPGAAALFARARDDGRADAALLARWAALR